MLTVILVSIGLVVLAVVAIVAAPLPRRASGAAPRTGHLDRRTRRSDRGSDRGSDRDAHHDRRRDAPAAPPARRPERAPAAATPTTAPDADAVGLVRRQFLNRSILVGMGLGVSAFGASSIAFLWSPINTGGFGGKINVGSISDVQAAFSKAQPYYNATAKTYLVPYPKGDLQRAKAVPAYTAPIISGMEAGYVALYQKCPHLGCRVPWCQTSQWFECPCHGSKYNRVGEKQAGPAPRGMDRFVFEVAGGNIVVDTGTVVLGPPIGTNTTDQTAQGPLCV